MRRRQRSLPIGRLLSRGAGIAARLAARSGRSIASGREVIEAARGGDAQALEVVHEATAALGVLDPEALVIGGGLGAADGPYWDNLLAATRSRIWSAATRGISIVKGSLGSDAGLIGAALATGRVLEG